MKLLIMLLLIGILIVVGCQREAIPVHNPVQQSVISTSVSEDEQLLQQYPDDLDGALKELDEI